MSDPLIVGIVTIQSIIIFSQALLIRSRNDYIDQLQDRMMKLLENDIDFLNELNEGTGIELDK